MIITNKVVLRHETQVLPRLRLICVAATGTNNIDLSRGRAGDRGKERRRLLDAPVAKPPSGGHRTASQHRLLRPLRQERRLLRRRTAVPFRTAHPPALRLEMGHRRTPAPSAAR
ncbi:MAG: hypothetical protein ACLRMJ_06765 [Alistipes finegoldii]